MPLFLRGNHSLLTGHASELYRLRIRNLHSLPFQRHRTYLFRHQLFRNMVTGQEPGQPRQGLQLKVPKGTRDWFGGDVILRDHIL